MSNLSIKSTNPNYLARVIRLPAPRKHSNADKLLCCNILNNNIITGLAAKEGDIYVYFPLECAINKEFLSYTNSFSSAEDNADKKTKGFFAKTARVRAIGLRGEKSEGYIVPANSINQWVGANVITEEDVDKDFDTINDVLICEKYVSRQVIMDADKAARSARMKGKKARESKIIEGQYYLAADTEHLKRNIHKISPEDEITIGYKLHGCNFSAGNVLCKKKLKWYEKILKKFGLNIVDTEYGLVWASRNVIKNRYADVESNHFYKYDIWGDIANRYKDCLAQGVTIHGEIVGQLPNGGWIQKSYDYGLSPTTAELYVYRMFLTNPQGKTFEFNTAQITDYCLKHGLKTVPFFYTGKAKHLFPEISVEQHWHENFLNKMMEKYNEKDCYLCVNKVPEEGVVLIKNNNHNFEAYKLKSFSFLKRETAELDAGIVNIEDTQSTDEELSVSP